MLDASPQIIEKNQDLPLPSAVTPVGQFEIPQYQCKEDDEPWVIINQGYIYYLGENNDIMQTTFSDLTKSKRIYHCPGWGNHLFNDERISS